jgi:hypothetical protein
MAGLSREMAIALQKYADANRGPLCLHPSLPVQVQGFHSVFRVAPSGQLLIELVAQFLQTDRSRTEELGGIPLRGGSTVIASADGTIRYVVSKPLPGGDVDSGQAARGEKRLTRQQQYLAMADLMDPETPYTTEMEHATRALRRADLARLHAG